MLSLLDDALYPLFDRYLWRRSVSPLEKVVIHVHNSHSRFLVLVTSR